LAGRREDQRTLRASILDRLLDDNPGLSQESVRERRISFGQIEKWLIRDLQNLLNSRQMVVSVPPGFGNLNRSLVSYGLRDFTAQNPVSDPVRQQLRQEIERVISSFEPRLRNVTVRLDTPSEKGQSLRFRVTGVLVAEPLEEPVAFDTYFDMNRGEFTISR
jgi:type VI secretion system protein ImpF